MIKHSAIKFYILGDDRPIIITGKRHADILERMFDYGFQYDRSTAVQGFLNDKNQFLDRRDAKFEARACHQLIEDTDYGELFSEDIWPE